MATSILSGRRRPVEHLSSQPQALHLSPKNSGSPSTLRIVPRDLKHSASYPLQVHDRCPGVLLVGLRVLNDQAPVRLVVHLFGFTLALVGNASAMFGVPPTF